MKKITLIFLSILIFHISKSQTQNYHDFSQRGEVYFSFEVDNPEVINTIAPYISITNIENSVVYAFANEKEFNGFLKFGYEPTILTAPSLLEEVEMYSIEDYRSRVPYEWNTYPDYDTYIAMMNQFPVDYPNLCTTIDIGDTEAGRDLMICKVTSQVNPNTKARILLTSTMHGDETTGYVLMLRLIDYLASRYPTDNRIKNILDKAEIWICPLANPDGTYRTGNHTVNGATRYNANNVDLNRNYKDDVAGDHPDGNEWQSETIAFMNLVSENTFTLGFNAHGGVEVCNYVWDNKSTLFADNQWWIDVCREYADTCHVQNSNYMTYLQNGITNGYQWYSIPGGRQDNAQAFHNMREMTLELSNTKLLPPNQLPTYWNYNYRSFLNFIERALYGIHGSVTDISTGGAIQNCKVVIDSHDDQFSFVVTDQNGYYARPIKAGTYTVTYTAPGYDVVQKTVTLNSDHETVIQDVQMGYLGLTADFTADNTNIAIGASVQFTDNSFSNVGVSSWNWTFEGGTPSTSTEQNPVVTYSDEGSFDVTLTISDGNEESTLTKENYINAAAEFIMGNSTYTTCSGRFYDSGGENGNYQNNENYVTTFLPSTPDAKIKMTFTVFDVENNYDFLKIYDGESVNSPLIGTYTGTNSPGEVIATNESGALTFKFTSDYASTKQGWVADIECVGGVLPAPIANFEASDLEVNIGEEVKFFDLSENNPTTWQWTFEGATPNSSTEQNPIVVYNEEGIYDVTLTVTNETGTDTKTMYEYIKVLPAGLPPVADFTSDIQSVIAFNQVNFTDMSENNPTSWQWSFEGGAPSTSTEQNPSVTYPAAGNYDVTLVVSNEYGSHQITKENYIQVALGIDNTNEKLVVYPNPAEDILHVEYEQIIDNIDIIDVSGRIVLSVKPNDYKTSFNLSDLVEGVYILRINVAGKELIAKISVK